MLSFTVEQYKVVDGMWARTGVDQEVFDDALLHYCRTDTDVALAMQKHMMKLRTMTGDN